MQATVLDLFNVLSNIARGGMIPVALATFWRMLDFILGLIPFQSVSQLF